MVSNRCKLAVKEELKKLGLHFILVDLGEVEIMETITSEQKAMLKAGLQTSGLDLMDDKKAILIERIKIVIIDLVQNSDGEMRIKFSNYLSEKLNHGHNHRTLPDCQQD